jgi:hypothetical protein
VRSTSIRAVTRDRESLTEVWRCRAIPYIHKRPGWRGRRTC